MFYMQLMATVPYRSTHHTGIASSSTAATTAARAEPMMLGPTAAAALVLCAASTDCGTSAESPHQVYCRALHTWQHHHVTHYNESAHHLLH